ncbi:MAG: transposase [Thiohalocapsa sp.]
MSCYHPILRFPPRQRPIGTPRHVRIAAGFPKRVILRGIARTAIFFAEDDYRLFSNTLAALAESESVRVHAYVLMTNQVHLLKTLVTDRGPARLMKGLGQRYVQCINRTYRRTGTLFVRRHTWPGTSGRPRKAPANTDQLDLSI